MRFLLRDFKANKIYYILITFSLMIFSFAISISITSFEDYYEKYLGSLVGKSKYIYEMSLYGVTDEDLKELSEFAQKNLNDINIITDINIFNGIFKIYVFNYNGWNNEIIDGNKLDNNTENVVVSGEDFKIGDLINIYPNSYNIIGKLDFNNFPELEKYIYIPYDNNRDKLGYDIAIKDGVLSILISSNRKINTEIGLIKKLLKENNDNLKINIINKKFQFLINSFKVNTYFFTRVLYSLCLIFISLINLVLFISYFSFSKRKEIYTKSVLGASNFSIIISEFSKLSICAIIASTLGLSIQQILDINNIKTRNIPMKISINNIIVVPIITILLVFIIVKFIYPKNNNDNISYILKE